MKDATGTELKDCERTTLWIRRDVKRKAKMRALRDDTTVSLMVERLLIEHLKNENGRK